METAQEKQEENCALLLKVPTHDEDDDELKKIEDSIKSSAACDVIIGQPQVEAADLNQSKDINNSEKLDELTSLEREIAKMHHVEPLSPALAQRVNLNDNNVAGAGLGISDIETGGGRFSEKVILEMQPANNNGSTDMGSKFSGSISNEAAAVAVYIRNGNEHVVESEVDTNAFEHEDLIAVLKGIDHHTDEEKHSAPSTTDCELAEEGVTIEGEGQFQIMEVIDDEDDGGSDDKGEGNNMHDVGTPTKMSGDTASVKRPLTKLTPEERAAAIEQIAGLNSRIDQKRRRKQDIKSLESPFEGSDLVQSLGADWSDDEGLEQMVAALGKAGNIDNNNIKTSVEVTTKEITATASKSSPNVNEKSTEAFSSSRASPIKVTSVVTLNKGMDNDKNLSAKNEPNDSIKSSTTTTTTTTTATSIINSNTSSSSTLPPQPTGFKRTRIIKRKIIWDPDAPETQFSYAQLVRSSVKTKSSPSPTSTVRPTAIKKDPPAKKVRPNTPKDKKITTAVAEEKKTARAATPSIKAKVSHANSNSMHGTRQKLDESAAPLAGATAKRRSQTPVANGGSGGKKKKISEIDRLMGDEGAINMLNALESELGSSIDNDDSGDKPHRPLMRSRAATISERIIKRETPIVTIKKEPSTTTSTSTTKTTKRNTKQQPKASSTWDYVYKQQANEDSMIIRRRSNSSYSSSASQHRLSIDGPSTSSSAVAPIKVNNKPSASKSNNTSKTSDKSNATTLTKSKSPTKLSAHGADDAAAPSSASSLSLSPTGSTKAHGRQTPTHKEIITKAFEFAKPNQKSSTVHHNKSTNSSAHSSLTSDMKKSATTTASAKGKTLQPPSVGPLIDDKEKSTVGSNRSNSDVAGGSSSASCSGKDNATNSSVPTSDVVVRKSAHVAQIIFNTHKAKLAYTFTAQMMNKLVDILDRLSKDNECRAVVMITNAPHFCQGIDFTDLTMGTPEKRKHAAVQLANAVKNYLKTIATFPKPLIAGVSGNNIGLGVTQLPLFDIVLASDKSTYETPYAKIGQVPEGYCIWNNITKIRHSFKTKLFWLCEKIHSTESALSGLVNKLTATSKVNEDAFSTAKKIAAMSTESFRVMKRTTIHNHLDAILTALDDEFDTIIDQWTSIECMDKLRKYLEYGHL